jgi:putative transposase
LVLSEKKNKGTGTSGREGGRMEQVMVTGSFKLKVEENPELDQLFEGYREMINELLQACAEKGITSLGRLHREKYRELREKYPHLNSKYIPDAMRMALGIYRNFRKRQRRRKTKLDRPVFKKSSILLHRRLFKLDLNNWKLTVTVGKGRRIDAELYHSYYHLKFRGMRQREAYLVKRINGYFLNVSFIKDVDLRKPNGKATAVDVNENNVTFGEKENIIRTETEERTIRTAYYLKRRRIWKKFRLGDYVRFGTPIPEKARRLLEKYRRKETRRILAIYHKIANKIIEKANEIGSSVIVMENLKHMEKAWRRQKNLKNPEKKKSREVRGRLNRWSFRKLQQIIEYKAKLAGLNVVYVNPRGTSSMCPVCGVKLSPNGHRQMRCPRCGFEGDRDVVAVLNLVRRYAEDVGSFPQNTPLGEPFYPEGPREIRNDGGEPPSGGERGTCTGASAR